MSIKYETTKWENGKTIIKASHFEKIEKGITDIIQENNSIYIDEDNRKANEVKREKEHTEKIKEVDSLIKDIKSDYNSLQKIIIDESASANLQNQINDVSSQLAHNTNYIDIKNLNSLTIQNLNLFDDRIFSSKEYSIKEIFPNVTLSEVQAIQSDATLNDSADWYVVMKLINYAHSYNIGYIQLPKGVGILSRTIDLTKKLYRCTILGKKSCLKASSDSFTGEAIIKLCPGRTSTNWGTSRLVTLEGVYIDGNFVEGIIGVFIDMAQEWLVSNCSIHNCFRGIGIADSWYGEVANETVIQDCVRGVEFLIGSTSEVNTIKFNNLKINCTLSLENRKKLAPVKSGEVDSDYKLRIPTVGIRIRTITGGIEFNGCTIEGQDIGLACDGRTSEEDGTNLGVNGINDGIFSLDNCYFEAIHQQFFRIRSITTGGISTSYKVSFSNCRFFGTPPKNSVFDLGALSVRSCQSLTLDVYSSVSRTCVQYNDSWTINNMSNSSQIFIDSSKVPTNSNPTKYGKFGNTNTWPSGDVMCSTIQGARYIQMVHPISDTTIFNNHKMMQVTNVPMTFIPSGYDKCGPVIKGDNNKYYMLQVDVNGNLVPRLLQSPNLAIPSYDMHNIRYLWNQRKTITTPCKCIYFDGLYFEINNNHDVFYTPSGNYKYPKIMKHDAYLIKESLGYSIAYGGLFVHLVDLNINIRNSDNKYVDWYGRSHDLLCVGTLAQRPTEVPTEAVGFKYIATDEGKIYEWDMNAQKYIEFTPYDTDK